jgi:hypothetical protein
MSRTDKCERCGTPTSFERTKVEYPPEGDVCYQCDVWICDDCTDWQYMKAMATDNPICVDCGVENWKDRRLNSEPNLPEDDPMENR